MIIPLSLFTPLFNDIKSKIPIKESELDRIPSFFRVKRLSKKDFLFRNNEVCSHDSYVVSGCLKAFYTNSDTGREEILFFSIEKWWATDMDSFSKQQKSLYSIQALEDTTLLQISRASFEDLLAELPVMERYFRIILEGYTVSQQKRIISRNSFSAEDRYEVFLSQYPDIHLRIPQYLIASYLGMTPEFLSRIRARKD